MRVLLSYHYFKDRDVAKNIAGYAEPPEVFADSGAYSARSLGAEVTVDGYAAWLHRWGHLFSAYASLDRIGDARASWDNHRALLSLGLSPLPVFHGGEDFAWLARYLDDHPYIGLGGMVQQSRTMPWAVKAFRMARSAGAVYHGFGQAKRFMLSELPWRSVDSSNWNIGPRWGMLFLWDDHRGRFVSLHVRDRHEVYRHAALLRAHGGDPAVISRPGFCTQSVQTKEAYLEDHRTAVVICVRAWLRLEAWLQARHGGDRPRIYLADARPRSRERGYLQVVSRGQV
jgi:hypothetical protein